MWEAIYTRRNSKKQKSLGRLSLFSWLYGVQGLRSPSRDGTLAPAVEVPSPNPWDTRGIPKMPFKRPCPVRGHSELETRGVPVLRVKSESRSVVSDCAPP